MNERSYFKSNKKKEMLIKEFKNLIEITYSLNFQLKREK